MENEEEQELHEIGSVYAEKDKELKSWIHNRIIIPICTYEKFIALGDNKIWTDAFIVYCHLYYTARLQKTNKVWANRTYFKNAFYWGSERVQEAILWLKENGFITINNQRKWKVNGRYCKVYITVKYLSKGPVALIKATGKVKKSKELDENRCLTTVHGNKATKPSRFKKKDAAVVAVPSEGNGFAAFEKQERLAEEDAKKVFNALHSAVRLTNDEIKEKEKSEYRRLLREERRYNLFSKR